MGLFLGEGRVGESLAFAHTCKRLGFTCFFLCLCNKQQKLGEWWTPENKECKNHGLPCPIHLLGQGHRVGKVWLSLQKREQSVFPIISKTHLHFILWTAVLLTVWAIDLKRSSKPTGAVGVWYSTAPCEVVVQFDPRQRAPAPWQHLFSCVWDA